MKRVEMVNLFSKTEQGIYKKRNVFLSDVPLYG